MPFLFFVLRQSTVTIRQMFIHNYPTNVEAKPMLKKSKVIKTGINWEGKLAPTPIFY